MQPNTAMLIHSAFDGAVYVADRLDVQNEPLYDTIDIAAAGVVTNLTTAYFTNVGANSGKTEADTNLEQQNELPSPEAWSVFGFRQRISEDILLADFISIMNGFALDFVMGRKSFNRGPLWYYGAGGGIFGQVSNITAEALYSNGVPNRDSMHKLAIPIVIENGQTFRANWVGTAFTLAAGGAGGTGLEATLLLDGLHARGVL